MDNQLQNVDEMIAGALATYDPTDDALRALAENYMPLETNGIEDRAAFRAVQEARRDVKRKRVAVDKRRKELKADALKYGRAVDARAKEITAELLKIEGHLQEQERLVTDEERRIEQEAEAARRAKIEDRIKQLQALGHLISPATVEGLSDEDFAVVLDTARVTHEERKREEERAAEERRQEQERLRAEREQFERERAEFERQKAEDERRRAEEAKAAEPEVVEPEPVNDHEPEPVVEVDLEPEAETAGCDHPSYVHVCAACGYELDLGQNAVGDAPFSHVRGPVQD